MRRDWFVRTEGRTWLPRIQRHCSIKLVQRETRGHKDLQDPEVSLVLQELKDNRALLDTRERREKRD